jgi:dipeptidyl aminopeptidase/acylaminoacyl peptidase
VRAPLSSAELECAWRTALCCVVPLVVLPRDTVAQRRLTVEDAVGLREFFCRQVVVSPDGSKVAYASKAANLAANRNDYTVYVRSVGVPERTDGVAVYRATTPIVGLKWLSDNVTLVMYDARWRGVEPVGWTVAAVDTRTRTSRVILKNATPLLDASMSDDGGTLAYVAEAPIDERALRDMGERGFAIGARSYFPYLFIGRWLPPRQCVYVVRQRSPRVAARAIYCGGESIGELGILNATPRVSPDGRHVVYSYFGDSAAAMRAEGRVPPTARWEEQTGKRIRLLGVYDVDAARTRIALPTRSFENGSWIWSDDSRSFSVLATLTHGQGQGDEGLWEVSAATLSQAPILLFPHDTIAVRSTSAAASRVPPPPAAMIVAWTGRGTRLLLKRSDGSLAWLRRTSQGWTPERNIVPPPTLPRLTGIATNGRDIVAMGEGPMTPPNLFAIDAVSQSLRQLTDRNPEYARLQLGRVDRLVWKNRYGSTSKGWLVLPVGYRQGVRYPVVIMRKDWSDAFISGGQSYNTAFAPQPLANVGFAVFMVEAPAPDGSLPAGAGGIVQSQDAMATVESGIDLLDSLGIADRANVGISGFSVTSWEVDYLLTHSSYRFAAAASADGANLEYSFYFLTNPDPTAAGLQYGRDLIEPLMGGPPFGSYRDVWLRDSPPFNADRVTAPVLLEYINLPGLVVGLEFYSALRRNCKAVDLFWYPRGQHVLDTPRERVASLQRNVDWFRFWMQHYEDPSQVKREQYARWRALAARRENPVCPGITGPDTTTGH